ncbi:MAG: hypothetical protein IT236_07945 [Bacteroidia bacterium]|nr:hypothetical protein [Bacteroidia bacterium]
MNNEKKKPEQTVKKTQAAKTAGTSFLERIDNWAAPRDNKIFYLLLIVSVFLAFITFNMRISEAHDDALYLEGGWRYVHEFPDYFYTQNAPLYPLFLGLLIKIIGFKLVIFKLFSMVFNILGFVLFYKALRGRMPYAIFLPVAVFQACNHLIIYFASMTFTEAFYFFLQGLFFFYAVKIIDITRNGSAAFKANLKLWLMLGLSMFLISTAKSSAIVVIPAILLYFLIEKNYKAMGFSLGSYLIFKLIYELLVRSVWKAQNQFAGQSKILLQKDPYDKALGNEDAMGFVHRFIDNCNLSLSKRFYQLLGWQSEDNIEINGYVTLLTIAIVLFGFWTVIKIKNKELLLLSLFTGAQLVLSFIILQARWDQPRITLVCMPVMLLVMFYGLFRLLNRDGMGPSLYLVIVFFVAASVIMSSFKRGFQNFPIVKKNLKGDMYYGYTPDWQNFLKGSEWCADNLPAEALVASRKAPMSFVYGKGKKFFPIYSVIKKDTATNQSDADSALAFFKEKKVTHVLLGSLRLNPNDPSAGIINTLHNIFAPINRKYPNKLKLIHTEGVIEQSYVYELVY